MSYYPNGQQPDYGQNYQQPLANQYQTIYPNHPTAYDNGEDPAYGATNGRAHNSYDYSASQQHVRSNSSASRANDELFIGDASAGAGHRPVGASASNTYAHQYSYGQASPPQPQTTYNPRSYVAPIQQPNPATYGGVNRTTFQPNSPPQPYNPAAYADNTMGRANTVSQSYGYASPTTQYTPTSPLQSSYPSVTMPQAQSYSFGGGRAQSQRDNRYNDHSQQSQGRPSAYTAPAPPPPPVPPSAASLEDEWNPISPRQQVYPSYSHSSDPTTNRHHVLPSPPIGGNIRQNYSQPRLESPTIGQHTSNPLPPTPPAPVPPPHRADTINRGNRPLPPHPSRPGGEEISPPPQTPSYFDQDDLFDDVERAYRGMSTGATSPQIQLNQQPIDEGEIDRSYSGSGRHGSGPNNSGSNGRLSPGDTARYYNYSDESDAEAAAGLAALQMAEQQEREDEARKESGNHALFSSYTSGSLAPPPQQYTAAGNPPDQGSDSDFVGVDMSSFQGGIAPSFSYGGRPDELAAGGSTARHDGGSQPVSTSSSIRRSEDTSDGSTSYEFDPIHPFPPFAGHTNPTARVDTAGTGGLSEPTPGGHRRRLSYDEGDESVLMEARAGAVGEIPDMFYHPGMQNRPLPPPPPGEPRYESADAHMRYGQLYAPDSYQQQTPGGIQVPRSTSLLNQSRTPQTTAPIRSKTDAEQTKKNNRMSTMYGSETSTLVEPQGDAVALDLPALPAAKRFNPAKLTANDFRKCSEPWALSSIFEWMKGLAAGEADLKEHAIVEGLQALFSYKVPTMSIFDVEALSTQVMQEMFRSGAVVRDEEWLKFSNKSTTGIIYQFTGIGCYSPKVHDMPLYGRCYSHHCQRTVKKIDLQSQADVAEQADWATYYKLKKEDLEGTHKKEIERQNILHEIVQGEDKFMRDLDVLRILYRDRLQAAQPPVIGPKKLAGFLSSAFGKADAVKKANEDHLLPQLKYRQQEQGPWIVGFSEIFREWIRKAKIAYIEYASALPYATFLIRQEADRNMLFRGFLDQARQNARSNRLGWDSFLKAPVARLQRYGLLLDTVLKNSTQDGDEKRNTLKALEEIKAVTMECDARVADMTRKVDLSDLQSKLILRPGMQMVELNLDHLGRELIHQGDLQRMGNTRFTLQDSHALLFDHYLVLAKTVGHREVEGVSKSEKYDINKLPIPMQLLVLESTDDEPVVKSALKGITGTGARVAVQDNRLGRTSSSQSPLPGALTHTNTSTSVNSVSTTSSGRTLGPTISADAKDDKVLYPFRIKHLGKDDYTLFATSSQNRSEWCAKIVEAKTKHAAGLFTQNAEPFRLRVMADSAFAYETGPPGSKSVVIKGTPLDRAIADVEKLYQNSGRPAPVCRARVNCATAFMQPTGKNSVAVGTDNAVYIAEVDNPRGWNRAIQTPKVSQIAVLEEFGLFLLISDKSLIAYHLDAICPVGGTTSANERRAPQKLSGTRDIGFFATGKMKDRTLVFYKKREGLSSTFKVLEPIFQKSNEKKSRFLRVGKTEYFRDYDEFYIPTECYGINLFHSSLAVSTSKGFEVLTLDKKQSWSVPDLKPPHVATIAARLANQTPLGMFRLSDQEFLLCYEECAVYVNKYGEISRSVIMEFVGKAKSAALYGPYVVLFDPNFVEIRNAQNGRLRQVIAGRDVKLLDDALSGGTAGHRTIKVCMQHPEVERSQIVVELLLNEGLKE
ncbi:hypothetical protein EJ05DRAFT_509942 [Pseudovirgaria hyperparasitica]|uniref:CNH-domain-containing protein n=1 Tax=Pseudovirgaria hyperparasitica TaxID=470096 RepID=A0A6A6W8T5_9PEZI|nr:uncharacterized protein EJ05DRAFT_509942 [Pseudovirgaria hyperparasitica]KAF2759073.1 hypothetical protein EJ05DRAFT_509942 [Pseudovirgaria hyperparasitica]